MTDPQQQSDQGSQHPPSAGTQNTETDHMIPKTRLDQVINERNDLRERLKDLEAAQKEQREKALAEQNEYKQLYEDAQAELEQLKAAQEQATRYRSSLEATNQSRIEQIPEEKRHLVPDFDDPVKLGQWLDKSINDLTAPSKPQPPKLDGGAGQSSGEKPVKLTDYERALIAASGMTEEQYIKQKARRGQAIDIARHAQNMDNEQE